MERKKLDRSKPFAETIGESFARYHQDGKDFDGQGNEIVQPADTEQDAEPAKRKPGRPKVSHDLEP